MKTHRLFTDFNGKITLTNSKIEKLKANRRVLRKKIKDHFADNGWAQPKFYSQGSFALNTNLNPIKQTTADGDVKEAYDLDDGVYFICPEDERKEVATYHDRLMKAVGDHAAGKTDKNTCVRVVYADGHHIDMPSYWLAENGNVPQLAHKAKGYIESDPKAFKDWVDEKLSWANSQGQLKRLIRYLKAWKNYRENCNSSLKLPSGFILTILACKYFSKADGDDVSMRNTVQSIRDALNMSFTCYRPTVPTNEELLGEYSKDTVLKELGVLLSHANKALDTDCEYEASESWRKVFGGRFPLGEKDDNSNKHTDAYKTIHTPVSSPWGIS